MLLASKRVLGNHFFFKCVLVPGRETSSKPIVSDSGITGLAITTSLSSIPLPPSSCLLFLDHNLSGPSLGWPGLDNLFL